MSKAKTRQRSFKKRIVTNRTDSQDIMSCSLPSVMNKKIKEQIKSNAYKKASPNNRSEFIRTTMEKFFDVMQRIMERYPEIFINEKKDPNWAESFTFNFGAENINKLNLLVENCAAFYNRSETIRMSILIYHLLEMIGDELITTNPSVSDIKEIQYVKMGGKIRPILNLDYESPISD